MLTLIKLFQKCKGCSTNRMYLGTWRFFCNKYKIIYPICCYEAGNYYKYIVSYHNVNNNYYTLETAKIELQNYLEKT